MSLTACWPWPRWEMEALDPHDPGQDKKRIGVSLLLETKWCTRETAMQRAMQSNWFSKRVAWNTRNREHYFRVRRVTIKDWLRKWKYRLLRLKAAW